MIEKNNKILANLECEKEFICPRIKKIIEGERVYFVDYDKQRYKVLKMPGKIDLLDVYKDIKEGVRERVGELGIQLEKEYMEDFTDNYLEPYLFYTIRLNYYKNKNEVGQSESIVVKARKDLVFYMKKYLDISNLKSYIKFFDGLSEQSYSLSLETYVNDLRERGFVAYQELSYDMQNNINFVKRTVQEYWWLLEYLPQNYKSDFEVLKVACKVCGWAMKYASEGLKDNKELAQIAVNQDGWSLQFLSKRLQDDKEVVDLAIFRKPVAIMFASKRLQSLE